MTVDNRLIDSNGKKSINRSILFRHIIDESDKDIFYLTKILISVVGKHAGILLLRLAIYILVVFPFLTEVVGLSRGYSTVVVFGLIIIYYSGRAAYDRLKVEVENGSG